MEDNNRKGPGIFYAVVGVATLVVAIIGATFAFFSASASDPDTIQGTTASAGGLDLSVTPITDTNTDLIPLNLILNSTASDKGVDQFDDAMDATKGGVCKDSNGNNVCQVYKITVSNKSTTSNIQIRGTLALTSPKGGDNLYWRLIDATEAEDVMSAGTKVDYSSDIQVGVVHDGYAEPLEAGVGHLTVEGNSGIVGAAADGKDVASKTLVPTSALEGDNSATYYVVVWLEEMGVAQETGNKDNTGYSDSEVDFKGTVSFSAVDASGNSSGITASFSA